MTSFDIRKASANDIISIVKMKLQMFEEAGIAMGMNEDDLNQFYQRLYAEEKAFHFVVQDAGHIVAMAGGFYKDDFPFCLYPNPVYGFIGDVFVHLSHRKQGIARKLSSMVMDEFKHNNITEIRLLASDVARPIYKSLGFMEAEMMLCHV